MNKKDIINPLGYPMSMYATKEHRELAMAKDRIAELEQELADLRRDVARAVWIRYDHPWRGGETIYDLAGDLDALRPLGITPDLLEKGQDDE